MWNKNPVNDLFYDPSYNTVSKPYKKWINILWFIIFIIYKFYFYFYTYILIMNKFIKNLFYFLNNKFE